MKSPLFEPPPEVLKKLLMNSFAGSSEAVCEEYTMSKKVDRKIQSKLKCLEANLLWISP
jgi:hypothetical protein